MYSKCIQISTPIKSFILTTRVLKNILALLSSVDWKQSDKEKIELVDDHAIPEILKIQSEAFPNQSGKDIIKFSKYSGKTFYVIKSNGRVAGYCVYYLKPKICFKGIKKQSVIHSLAIRRNFRLKGFSKALMKESIEEMKLNKVSSISLYVNEINAPAIKLYEKMGFIMVKQAENICGQKEKCYKMELKLI